MGTNRADCSCKKDARDKAHSALDGKTIRATTSTEERGHLLSFYEVQTGLVLTHCQVREKQNAISVLKPLLTPPLVTGRILTVHAMHTQRAFWEPGTRTARR